MKPRPYIPRRPVRSMSLLALLVVLSAIVLTAPAGAVVGSKHVIYVPSISFNTLTTIDTDTNTVLGVEPFGSTPVVTASNGDHSKLVATNWFASSLEIRDNASGAAHRVELPSNAWTALPMSNKRDLVMALANNTVAIFNSSTEKITKTIKVIAPFGALHRDFPIPPGVISVALSPDDQTLYVAYGTGGINAYRLSDGQPVKPVIQAQGLYPAWFDISPDGRWLFSLNIVGDVTVVDTKQWKVVNRIPPFLAMTAQVTPDGKRIFLAGLNGLTAVDLRTLEVVGRIPAAGIAGSVIFNDDGTRGYFGTTNNGLLPWLDLFALRGFGRFTSIQRTGLVQEFNPTTYEKVGKPIPVGAVPGVIAPGNGWTAGPNPTR